MHVPIVYACLVPPPRGYIGVKNFHQLSLILKRVSTKYASQEVKAW